MEMPSSSYRPLRASLTRWDSLDEETGLHFTADLPDPLSLYLPPRAAAAAASPTPNTAAGRPRASVEAARHAVLRRLAPALKHDMVVNLQAVSMMAEMMNARLERGEVATSDLQANIAKLNRLAREAVLKCLNVSSWIDAGEDDTMSLTQAVRDCVSLMSGSFNFRGYTIVNEVPEVDFDICMSTVRNLLAASLMTLADESPSPSELRIRGDVSSGVAVLTITSEPQGDPADRVAAEPPPLALDWTDVQALARLDSAELLRNDDIIVIRVPRTMPSTPLRMAPI